jgi:transposase
LEGKHSEFFVVNLNFFGVSHLNLILKTMIITRKIQIYIPENDKKLRKEYYETLYNNRYIAVKIANMTVSHLFALDNSMPYLSEEDKDSITFLGVKGDKATRRNAPYVVASEAFKGQIDMGVCSTIQNTVRKHYQEDKKAGMWKRSLRSYKANMPVPYQANRFRDIRVADYETKDGKKRSGIFFTLTGIPFQMCFGRDRSGNRIIVERIISGEYKMVTSSIQVDDDKKKIFLLLCVDIPQKEVVLKPDKKLYAFLGVFNPITCTTDINSEYRVWKIGTEEEFNHRRRQIQEAVKRCQINNKYSVGGKGRKKKNKAIERFHDKEKNYVDTKLHTYSRMLVDMAIKHECSEIVLMKQIEREDKAKEDNKNEKPFVLRNWSYYGLKDKIQYKSKMYGIKLTVE